MKFSCTQENLNHGLQLVGHVANKNINLPILQNVLVKAHNGNIILSATNLEIGIRVTIRGKVEEEGEFTLPGQLLTSYVNLLPDDKIDCVLIGKEFSVAAQNHKSIIKGESAAEYPILPEISKERVYIVTKEEFEQGLQQVVVAASIDESRPEIAGVLFNFDGVNLTLAATDSYRLAEKKLTLKDSRGGSVQVIVPQRSAQELLRVIQLVKAETIALYVNDNQIGCDTGDIEFVSRVIEGNFPPYQDVIPQQGNTTASLGTNQLIKAVKSVALFSKTGINDIQLEFLPQEGQVLISAMNVQVGENTTSVKASITGQENTIIFNYRYLLDGLQQIKVSEVEFRIIDALTAAVMVPKEENTYRYIIMPIKQ